MAQANTDIVRAYGASLEIDAKRSRIRIGGHEVSFHCDKFNTRIIKGFEDVVGFDDAGRLLAASAEQASYKMFSDFFAGGGQLDAFNALSAQDRLATLFEMGKLLGYGAVNIESVSETQATFVSPSSYLAEGWLENQERWNWKPRKNPVCYDMNGFLQAALAFVFAKPEGSYKVTETTCRAKGDQVCTFKAEVK
jgi:predicted hydrocarbon binding protein